MSAYNHVIALFLAFALSLAAAPAWPHPGRTDASGCHTNRKTGEYHCHGGGKTAVPARATKAKPAPREFEATVLRVSDGDTITVRTGDFEDIRVRLYGIDAPESNQPGGAEATAYLKPLQGQTVRIIEMDVDRYSRTVALVEHGGRALNLDLAAQGHAWYYGQYCKRQPICGQIQAAEGEAKAARRGLWAGEAVAP